LFFRNYSSGNWLTGHIWSLSVEEHFYLIWPLLLVAAEQRRARWIAPSLAAVVVLWQAASLPLGMRFALGGNQTYRSDYRMDGLLLGATVALWLRSPSSRAFIRHYCTQSIALVAFAVAFLSYRALFSHTLAKFLMPAVLFPICIASTAMHPGSFVSRRILENPAVAWIGKVSYSIYLWQQLFTFRIFSDQNPIWRRPPLNMLLIGIFALLSFLVIERPALKFGHRLLGRTGD